MGMLMSLPRGGQPARRSRVHFVPVVGRGDSSEGGSSWALKIRKPRLGQKWSSEIGYAEACEGIA